MQKSWDEKIKEKSSYQVKGWSELILTSYLGLINFISTNCKMNSADFDRAIQVFAFLLKIFKYLLTHRGNYVISTLNKYCVLSVETMKG